MHMPKRAASFFTYRSAFFGSSAKTGTPDTGVHRNKPMGNVQQNDIRVNERTVEPDVNHT
jgi:hypothetical protein